MNNALSFISRHLFGRIVQTADPRLDLKLGFALLRDRRVPLKSKVTALGLGLAATALLVAMELPLEIVVAALLPVLGLAGDFAVDGLEAVAGPILIGAALLPFIAPDHLVRTVKTEIGATVRS